MPADFYATYRSDPDVVCLLIEALGGSFRQASGPQVNVDCIFMELGAEDIQICDTKPILSASAGNLVSK